MLKVGVNGFGRIGRNFLRASLESGAKFEIVLDLERKEENI